MPIDGTTIKDTFYLIRNDPNPAPSAPSAPASPLRECCSDFSLRALADTGSADPLKNDVYGFIRWFDPVITSATMGLYKWDGSAYSKVDDLDDDTYGKYYGYGFFTNKEGEQFVGYQLAWKNVLTAFGAGSYKIGVTATPGFGGAFTNYSEEYCLKQYSGLLANITVRIEYYLNGVLGVSWSDTLVRDLGTLNWYNSYRIPGYFGYPSSTYQEERVQYNSGARVFVDDFQEPIYILKAQPIPFFLHEILRIDVMQADTILITNYDNLSPAVFVKKSVFKAGDYAPNWNREQSRLATVELKFKQTTNRLRKFRY